MEFVALMKQSGEGCDYTIGCGRQIQWLSATTLDEAKNEARQILEDYGSYRGSEMELESFLIVPVTEVYDWLEELYDEVDEQKRIYKEQRERERELAELERLQQKYK